MNASAFSPIPLWPQPLHSLFAFVDDLQKEYRQVVAASSTVDVVGVLKVISVVFFFPFLGRPSRPIADTHHWTLKCQTPKLNAAKFC